MLLALSGASVAWFFPARRYMITLMKSVAVELEEALRPVDATYTMLGLYVGFHARFRVSGLREYRALRVLLPRHALLYLPFALARGEKDVLVLEAEPHGGTLFECCETRGKLPRSVKRQLRRVGVASCKGGCPEGLRRLLGEPGVWAVWAAGGAVGAALTPKPGLVARIARSLAEYARRV